MTASIASRNFATLAGLLILLTGCMVLNGCVSAGPATEEQVQSMASTCQSYGFKPGTDNFAQCVANLDAQRVQSAQIAAERRRQVGLAMMAAGAAQRPAPMTTCRTTRLGNSLQTQCM